jgi:hypothetical protein
MTIFAPRAIAPATSTSSATSMSALSGKVALPWRGAFAGIEMTWAGVVMPSPVK